MKEEILKVLEKVTDPEIPVLTIQDMGIIREVKVNGEIEVIITPTYSGCPAMQTMEDDIRTRLAEAGYTEVMVRTQLSPAWTTDWMSAEGKSMLEEFGIAPPSGLAAVNKPERCPRCASKQTTLISEYGSTACKAMYQCEDCKENFCYFKVI